jgi:Uma2 family endonuclease
MATAEMVELMTAEQFAQRPDSGYPEELVRGRVVAMPVPDRRHGYVCGRAVLVFGSLVDAREMGRVLCNDSGVITGRDPDTMRGSDVAYYSFARLPRGKLPTGVGPEVPELFVEVRSATDRWRNVLDKVSEYLNADVRVVVVLDPEPQATHVFSADDPPRTLTTQEDLILPEILDDFRVRGRDSLNSETDCGDAAMGTRYFIPSPSIRNGRSISG